jgi:DNA-binding GntR family transcriptional regulator
MAALRTRDTAAVERALRDHFERASVRLTQTWRASGTSA